MRTLVPGVVRTVPLSPFALIRSTIAKKMQVNEEKNIKIVVGSKKVVPLQPQSRNNSCKGKGFLG